MMNLTPPAFVAALSLSLAACTVSQEQQQQPQHWSSWRGPMQNGTSAERNLPDKVEPGGAGWTYELAGRGTPVVNAGRVYSLGYRGERSELQEVLVCLDEATGRKIWEHGFTDFLSDVIYYRYSIGSPTIDPATGNVVCLSTPGLLSCFTGRGKLLWQHSMMSEYGRLTFPNGRTGAPLVVDDLVIVHVATSGWGAHGPARDRFFAFDKNTGKSIWSTTPGGPPKDTSFSFPVLDRHGDRSVLYAGLAGGHLVCMDTRTGDSLWRFQMSIGGMSSSPVLYKDKVIAVHGKENLDTSEIGRMVAIQRDTGKEVWRNDLCSFTSSPVLVGNRVYQTVATGDLCCVDADTGKTLWHEKLAPDQIHASPAYGDGKLYVPMNNGSFHVIEPSDKGPKILQTLQLKGNCLGAPAIANGRIYVHTTDQLYCFGNGTGASATAAPAVPAVHRATKVGKAVRLQVIPADVVYRGGTTDNVVVRSLDANGLVVDGNVSGATFQGLPSQGVSLEKGVLKIADNAPGAAAVVKVQAEGLSGTMRLRIVPALPYANDFESVASPPPYWVGAGPRWEVLDLEGNKVLARTLDNPLFQRTMSLIGHPDMANYTVQLDLLTDGNRRTMSSAGVVNQRYLIVLKGNHQELEVSSNVDLLKESVPFRWKPKTWYRLKTKVELAADGKGMVRAKVWQRDQEEPPDWTIEVAHKHAHKNGSPGIYGFVPQSRFRVYIDNLTVTPND